MRVLACGSRTWTDYDAIADVIADLPPGSTVIHGGAQGADALADRAAREHGHTVEVFAADWERHGRAAGPLRNQAMIDTGPALVIAAWDGRSKGTADTIRRAGAAGIAVLRVEVSG